LIAPFISCERLLNYAALLDKINQRLWDSYLAEKERESDDCEKSESLYAD